MKGRPDLSRNLKADIKAKNAPPVVRGHKDVGIALLAYATPDSAKYLVDAPLPSSI